MRPTSHDPFIDVRDITFTYHRGRRGECLALSGLSLAVRKGEFLAVVGPNGSGKSTLARHLNALLLPSEGKVLVDGLDTGLPENVWEIRCRVGMVFQNPDNQIVSSLVEEDVAFGVENLGILPEEVRERVNWALDLTGLSQYRRHAPHLLSGGQKQRLAIAGVLAMRTSCLVLDEPSAMLDPAGRRELLAALARLKCSTGVTVVFVTHCMEEAAHADRVAVLSGGRLVLEGPPCEVFAREELLEELGLELPAAAKIAGSLRRRGFFMPAGIITVDDLASFLTSTEKGAAPLFKERGHNSVVSRQMSDIGIDKKAYSTSPIIRVENLTHVYSAGTPFMVVSLDNVSLEINKGEFFALIGATGSGKSTLVQHFNGILSPTAGNVWVGDIEVRDKKLRRNLWRKVGLVFQQPEQQLFEETVFDDVAFGPRNMGLGRAEVEERVNEALNLVGLDPAAVGPLSPFSLSGGMLRRAAIAGVLALRPEVLILDEPAAGLDPKGRRQLLECIDGFRSGQGVTVILVTHDMEEVALWAGRVAVLHQGRLVMEGAPREVFSRVAQLHALGLDVPAPAQLMHRLQVAGKQVNTDLLTASEAEEEIAKLLGRETCDV